MNTFSLRLMTLIKKEYYQLVRDKSSFLIGIIFPIILIFLIGYGLSLDVKNVPVAVVLEDNSPTAHDVLSFIKGSEYFSPIYVTNMRAAERLLDERRVDVIVRIPNNFTASLKKGEAEMQIILWGVDAATARIAGGYLEAGIARWQAINAPNLFPSGDKKGMVTVLTRQWFNDANTSTWFFIPGLIVMIITLVGVFLTTMVMAREWERGTLESLFVTPVRPLEILLSKMIPYFFIAMIGFWLCIAAARFLYRVPIHGSFFIILLSSVIYLLVSLGMGLTISSTIKNQFLASQLAMLITLLPTLMLSGFLFDLRNTPFVIQAIGHIFPATYYMELLKSLFLTGNNWYMIFKNCGILLSYAFLFLGLSFKVTQKRLE